MARIIDSDFLHRALQHFYGYSSFRTGQEEITRTACVGSAAYGCRQEYLLSAAFTAFERRDAGNLAADIADEGSGGGADGTRYSSRLS